MVRCRLQPGEGVPRRPFRSAHIGVCDIREAAARERAASAAGNRPLFYFRFGEPCISERDQPPGKMTVLEAFPMYRADTEGTRGSVSQENTYHASWAQNLHAWIMIVPESGSFLHLLLIWNVLSTIRGQLALPVQRP